MSNEFFEKELSLIQKRIERKQFRLEGNNGKILSPYSFDRLSDEIRALKEIEDFLWNKLD